MEEFLTSGMFSFGGEFKLHRIILAKRSTFFRSMLSGNWKEAQGSDVTLGFSEVEDKQSIFPRVVKYMYGGKPELDNENIREMLTSARIFGIEDLEQLCVAYIDHMLHKVENILVFVELFAKFEDIKERCIEVVARNFDLLARKVLSDFPSMLSDVLARDDLVAATEFQVVTVLSTYLSKTSHEVTEKQRADMCARVRLGFIPSSDFEETLRLLPLEKSAFAQALAWRAAEYESPGKELPGVECYTRRFVFATPGGCTWRLSGFSELSGNIRSISFPDRQGKLWYCSLDVSKDEIGFFLNVDADAHLRTQVNARYTVEFVSAEDPGLSWRKTLDWHTDWTRGWGWGSVITHARSELTEQGILHDDSLTLIVHVNSH